MAMIFDSHAHYDHRRFNDDREVVIDSLRQNKVGAVLNSASNVATSEAALALAKKYGFFRASAGIHPDSADQLDENAMLRIEQLCKQPEVVALGEIGLDYHYPDGPDRETQLYAFRRQLELAHELDIPVIIHSREAAQDTFELVREFKPRGVMHCFSYSAEFARQLTRLGMYIGFTGTVTFSNARKPLEAAAAVPQSRLLIETDCPYMAPVPYRGKRCDSTMLHSTAAAIAAAREMTAEQVIETAWNNAFNCFELGDWQPDHGSLQD